MKEALRVNPYNIDSVADALHQALVMSRDQRETRMRALQRRERRDDLGAWLGAFLGEATRRHDQMDPVRENDIEGWLGRFVGTHPLAVFLDFDGTLTPIASHPSMVKLSNSMREVLAACADRKDTDVMIVSGRGLQDVRRQVPIDGIVFAGNPRTRDRGPRHRALSASGYRPLRRACRRARPPARRDRHTGCLGRGEGGFPDAPLSRGQCGAPREHRR